MGLLNEFCQSCSASLPEHRIEVLYKKKSDKLTRPTLGKGYTGSWLRGYKACIGAVSKGVIRAVEDPFRIVIRPPSSVKGLEVRRVIKDPCTLPQQGLRRVHLKRLKELYRVP